MCYYCYAILTETEEDPYDWVAPSVQRMVTSALADLRTIKSFLETLEFSDVDPKTMGHGLAAFYFGSYNARLLDKELGVPEVLKDRAIYTTKKGTITVFPKKKIVEIKDTQELEDPKAAADETHALIELKNKEYTKQQLVPKDLLLGYQVAQHATPEVQRQWMIRAHKYWNDLYFGGRLPVPTVALKRDVGDSARLYGEWDPKTKKLSVSPLIFRAELSVFLCTFVHEMAHQAVSQIDHADRMPDNLKLRGHGTNWQTWMKHCGLEANRYVAQAKTEYEDQLDKEVRYSKPRGN